MPKPREIVFAQINTGDTASFETLITNDTIAQFASLSGDYNPLHTDDAYAQTLHLDSRIPHGMIAGAFFSRLVGMELPGLHSMYMSQTYTFHHPLPINKTIVVRGEVLQKIESVQSVKLSTTIQNKETGEILVKGEALVRVLA